MAETERERTLVIVKPDGVRRGLIGKVIGRVKELNLEVTSLRRMKMGVEECRKLYAHIRESNPAIYRLVEKYMTSDNSFLFTVEGEKAVEKVGRLRGATDLNKATPGSIRHDFVTDEMREKFTKEIYVENVMHASGSSQEAKDEIAMFFTR